MTTRYTKCGLALAGVLAVIGVSAKADTFRSGANTFTIDFVNIGNAGNGDDLGSGGGIYSSPYGGDAYTFRMAVTEVTVDAFRLFSNLSPLGPGAGDKPQGDFRMSWYGAAAFVNFLNTSTGHHAAYNANGNALWLGSEAWDNDPGPGTDLNLYRHKDAYYFLPSEDEWYKAGYHKNDGVTANYWDYATGSNDAPSAVASGTDSGTAVYNQPQITFPFPIVPSAVVSQAGGQSPYGTRGQNGNVSEWLESTPDGFFRPLSDSHVIRGGSALSTVTSMRASFRGQGAPGSPGQDEFGFRVASVATPEPSSTLLLLGSAWVGLLRRRRTPGV